MTEFGALKIITDSFYGLAWHWRWSIAWRWIIQVGRGNWGAAYARKGFYWLNHKNGHLTCGLNSPLFDFSFTMQPNLRRK